MATPKKTPPNVEAFLKYLSTPGNDVEKAIREFEAEWQSEYGEQPPKTMSDWAQLAARAGYSGESIERKTVRQLEPVIRGYLKRLREKSKKKQAPPKPKGRPVCQETKELHKQFEAGRTNAEIQEQFPHMDIGRIKTARCRWEKAKKVTE